MNKYTKGDIVWVRPRLANKPLKGTYIRPVYEEEKIEGYRAGEIVELEDGREVWVRNNLCGFDPKEIEAVES